ncbi:hypothetical protein Tco_1503244 [Tanacetum coccineum]
MFNSRDFFLPKEILPPKKQARTYTLEILIEDIQIRHRSDMKNLLDKRKVWNVTRSWVIIQQDFDNLEAELRESQTQIVKHQRKQMGNNSKIALARFRMANLEQIIEDILVRHQADKECLLNAIYEHKNSQEGPSDY